MNRIDDLHQFYDLLDMLERKLGGKQTLRGCHGRMDWPNRGLYFFFEPGELRSESGVGHRVVRVGTHAVSKGSKSKLWGRLAQHRGTATGIGNHRGSVFRLLVGAALSSKCAELAIPSWGHGQSAPRPIRETESALEREVSAYIGSMPFLWLSANDDPSPNSVRAFAERNAIALLSNWSKAEPLDTASHQWLGRHCSNKKVARSGLWNSRCVDEQYEPAFLEVLARKVDAL
ncbi:MAG: hypothetical protein M3Y57_06295 [Acidobacteriota bacterium]|nr:hypothetical protein [Acidobacteriota bacterium]